MVCAKRALCLAGLLVLLLPAVSLVQAQTPELRIDTGANLPVLLNSNLQALEKGGQEIISYQLVLFDEPSEIHPSSVDTDLNRRNLPQGTPLFHTSLPLAPPWNSSTGEAEPSTNVGGFVGGRFRVLKQAIRNTQNSITVLEGNSATFEISLTSQPSADVTYTVTGHENTTLTVTPTTLTFTSTDWAAPRQVTVTANQDFDEADNQVTLSITAVGRVGHTVNVTILDDEQTWELSPILFGEGQRISFNVSLLDILPPPSDEVTLTITGHENTDLNLGQTTLIFPLASWQRGQLLSLTTNLDNDSVDDYITLVFTASGGNYNGLKYTMDVTIVDRPPEERLLPEGGTISLSYRIKSTLFGQLPAGDHIAVFDQYDGTDLIFDPTQLIYKASSWYNCSFIQVCSAFETTKLTAQHDSDDVDDQNTIRLTVTSGRYKGLSRLIHVRIEDDDDPGLVVDPPKLEINEGAYGEFTVKLSVAPLGDFGSNDVTVTIPSSVKDLTPNRTSLTFTASNWDEEQTVGLTAEHDDDFKNDTRELWVTAQGGGFDYERGSVLVTITDDDTRPIPTITLTASPNPVTEGESVTITATISEDPTADVMIPLTITAGTAEASDYGGLATSRITISGTGSGTTGTVTIPTFEDDSEYDNETFTVAIHENGLPATVAAGIPKEVLVTITDDDTRPIPTITLTASPNPVTEGESVTITATISEDPTADVMVPLTITAGTAEASDYGGLATSRITISGTGSGTTGTVTIPTFEDDSEYDNETFTVAIHENGLPATVAAGIPKEVLVTITDDDTRPIPTITLTASPNPVTEGESVTITATISEDPTADVMIPLTITAGTAEASDYGGLATGRITISGTGSGTTGTVTIPTFEDDSEYDNETFTVAIHENGLPATVAAGIPKEVLVTITDDDTRPIPTITLTASPNPVTEGESVTITATISEDPTADVMTELPP